MLYKKETLAQVFSCEFWKMFKNTSLTEHLRVTASAYRLISWPSLLRTPIVLRRSSRKKKLDTDQLKEFQEKGKAESFETFSQDHAPSEFKFKGLQECVQYYRLIFDS